MLYTKRVGRVTYFFIFYIINETKVSIISGRCSIIDGIFIFFYNNLNVINNARFLVYIAEDSGSMFGTLIARYHD